MSKENVRSAVIAGFIGLAIWMTITTLTGWSKAGIVGGGWAAFVVAGLIGAAIGMSANRKRGA